MNISREGHEFFVENDPASSSWQFWESQFATGKWEPELLELMDRLLDDGGLYLDIGAWIGPTVLWASRHADRMVAVEPDPVAYETLAANIALNGLFGRTRLVPQAIADHAGAMTLHRRDMWGSSMSSLIGGDGSGQIEIEACRLTDLELDEPPALIKIDIEGGEALVIPDSVGLLGVWGCPVLLSLHWPWLNDTQAKNLSDALSEASTVAPVADTGGFETVLVSW